MASGWPEMSVGRILLPLYFALKLSMLKSPDKPVLRK
jgi:hypothetical protein